MSGHSKWATTKHKKALVDAKRSKNFSKLANLITLAAKKGGDPEGNPTLRDVILKARSFNMPQDNIERAIKRGTGEIPGLVLEEYLIELYGPEGIAVLVRIITDNKNRTLGEIRGVLNSLGGSLANPGSVSYLFKPLVRTKVVLAAWQGKPELELKVIEAGAEDIKTEGEEVLLYAGKAEAEAIKKLLQENGLEAETELDYLAQNPVSIAAEDKKEKLANFFGALYELNDVDEVYSNARL